jgi:hypothetical protein
VLGEHRDEAVHAGAAVGRRRVADAQLHRREVVDHVAVDVGARRAREAGAVELAPDLLAEVVGARRGRVVVVEDDHRHRRGRVARGLVVAQALARRRPVRPAAVVGARPAAAVDVDEVGHRRVARVGARPAGAAVPAVLTAAAAAAVAGVAAARPAAVAAVARARAAVTAAVASTAAVEARVAAVATVAAVGAAAAAAVARVASRVGPVAVARVGRLPRRLTDPRVTDPQLAHGLRHRRAHHLDDPDRRERQHHQQHQRGERAAAAGLGHEQHREQRDGRPADGEQHLGRVDALLPRPVGEPERARDDALAVRREHRREGYRDEPELERHHRGPPHRQHAQARHGGERQRPEAQHARGHQRVGRTDQLGEELGSDGEGRRAPQYKGQ